MPQSDKPISTASPTDSVVSAGSRTWSSHANVEDAQNSDQLGLALVDAPTEESVEVETVVNLMEAQAPTVAILNPEPRVQRLELIRVYGWTTVRTIEGRTYTRVDERHEVSETE
jgi:hypothetical protein